MTENLVIVDVITSYSIHYTKLYEIPDYRLEYFEIVEDRTLAPVSLRKDMSPDRLYYACIALFAGGVRLIDNIEVRLR